MTTTPLGLGGRPLDGSQASFAERELREVGADLKTASAQLDKAMGRLHEADRAARDAAQEVHKADAELSKVREAAAARIAAAVDVLDRQDAEAALVPRKAPGEA